MADNKYSIEDITERVELEGSLEYVIMHYLSADQIEDATLRDLFKQAKDILEKIDGILYPEPVA